MTPPPLEAGEEGRARTVRVESAGLEVMTRLVGELVVESERLARSAEREGAERVTGAESAERARGVRRLSRDLARELTRTRLQPAREMLERAAASARAAAEAVGKEIEVEIVGGEVAIERGVARELGEVLTHLVRNAVDHGLETAEERRARGKGARGRVTIGAEARGASVRVRVSDDGRGLNRDRVAAQAVKRGLMTATRAVTCADRELWGLIFESGFTTAERATAISGRGVGLDAVKIAVERLRGTIEVESAAGRGTTFVMSVPQGVAMAATVEIEADGERRVVMLADVVEVVRLGAADWVRVGGEVGVRVGMEVLAVVEGAGGADRLRIARPCEDEGETNPPQPLPRGGASEANPRPTPSSGRSLKKVYGVVVRDGERRGVMVATRVGGVKVRVVRAVDDEMAVRWGGRVSSVAMMEDGGVCAVVDVAGALRVGRRVERVAA